MSTIKERLQDIIDKRFARRTSVFAQALGISPNTIANYIRPKRASKPTSDFLGAVVEKLGIDAVWLLTGKGSMDGNLGFGVIRDDVGGQINSFNGNMNPNMPCSDEKNQFQLLRIEVKHLTEKLYSEKDKNRSLQSHIEDLKATIIKYDERIAELKVRIKELKEKYEQQ